MTAEAAAPATHTVDRTKDPLVSAQGVWKIFGSHAERIIGVTKAYRRLPKADRQALLAFLGTLTAPASPETSPTDG